MIQPVISSLFCNPLHSSYSGNPKLEAVLWFLQLGRICSQQFQSLPPYHISFPLLKNASKAVTSSLLRDQVQKEFWNRIIVLFYFKVIPQIIILLINPKPIKQISADLWWCPTVGNDRFFSGSKKQKVGSFSPYWQFPKILAGVFIIMTHSSLSSKWCHSSDWQNLMTVTFDLSTGGHCQT